MKTSREVFQEIYVAIPTTVAFDPEWGNGTGYYDGVIKKELGLKPGQMATSESPAPNSRRIILIGTTKGNLAVFERYSPTDTGERSKVYVSNAPSNISELCNGYLGIGSAIEPDGMKFLLGCPWDAKESNDKFPSNIGGRLFRMLSK